MNRLTYAQAVENSIAAILLGGTKIVSFRTPEGVWHHNVLIGSNKVRDYFRDTFQVFQNRAIAFDSDGVPQLFALENNSQGGIRPIMCFPLDHIRDFSALDPAHFYAPRRVSIWKRVKQFVTRNVLKICG